MNLQSLRIGAILNTSSGSWNAQVPRLLAAEFQAAEVTPLEIWTISGTGLDAALDAAAATALDVLIVFGGDGTIRAAAQQCAESGMALIPLPGGTMNMLPRALYGSRSWRDVLRDTLRSPVRQAVHGGCAGSHHFYVAAVLGKVALLGGAREAVRGGNPIAALGSGVSALRQTIGHELSYRFGADVEGTAEAVVALCPLPPPEVETEAHLEAAAIDVASAGDVIRLAISSAFRDWRSDQAVTRATVHRLEAVSDGPIPALLDGETFMLDSAVTVTVVRTAFHALRPGKATGDAG